MPKGNCEFTGKGGQYFVTVFIHLMLIGTITLGIYIPWAMVRLWKLKAAHTRINGKQVTFDGTGGKFLALCLIQGLLTFVTLGIYGPWALCRIIRWRTEHTQVGGKPSTFHGTGGSLFFLYLIHLVILPLLTLGIYYLWGVYKLYAWKEEHSRYGGEKTSFGAGFGQFVKITVLSWILNMVTFQLFSPWSICWLYKWQIEGLKVGPEPGVEHYPPVKTNVLVVILLIVLGLAAWYGLANMVKNQVMMAFIQANRMAQLSKMKAGPWQPSQLGPRRPLKIPAQKKRRVLPSKALKKAQPRVISPAPGDRARAEAKIEMLTDFIRMHPDLEEAYYNRALALFRLGRIDEAIGDFTKAIKINGEDADAHYNRGLLYLAKGQYDKAVADFAVVIKLNPNAVDAYCNRGGANFRLGRLDQALQDYTEAIKIAPNDPDLYHNRAIIYKAKGQVDKARADLAKEASLRKTIGTKSSGQTFGRRVNEGFWRENVQEVKIPPVPAFGMIHDEPFHLQDAKLDHGILTLREGKKFFADREIKVFFLSQDVSFEGKSFAVSSDKKFGVPHVHMGWMDPARGVPQIKIFTGGYSMKLRFGQREGNVLPGGIYVCLPDENNSYVIGQFKASLLSQKKY